MILGRTPGGAIKTKSNGGLRAVNCACCVTCGCYSILIPQALRELVANATIDTVTLQGYSAQNFYPLYENDQWLAQFSNNPEQVDFFAEIIYDKTTGCLSSTYISYGNTGVGGGLSLANFGDGQICEDFPTENGTFTLNGEFEYTYYYFTGIDPATGFPYEVAPPPNLVFT